MRTTARRTVKIYAATAVVPASLLIAGTTIAAASTARPAAVAPSQGRHPAAPSYRVRQILNGMKLHHTYVAGGKRHQEPLTLPDDITILGHRLFTGFQNGIGPQGQPSTDGNTDSTIVEFTATGRVIRQWDIKGKCDGLTADPARRVVIATVNEDAHSSIYTIAPHAPLGSQIRHYRYSRQPLPHNGGTDAISIYRGRVLISASAPGTAGKAAPQPTYPAVYVVSFHPASRIAAVSPLFYDEAPATVANLGRQHRKVVRLALTDPDSNEIVPPSAPRFAGDFMLTSQGDKEQIFLGRTSRPRHRLQVLQLSQSVDDTAWATSRLGRLYASDNGGDTVDVVTGPFPARSVLVAVTPCDANGAPATCPAPKFPPNYLGSLNPWTGRISRVPVRGPQLEPQGMVFARPGELLR
ncbi:MAG: hypothetical protein ACLPUO_02115 [Streptosporangiaceae bacterium]|jgi:hypothetical protein